MPALALGLVVTALASATPADLTQVIRWDGPPSCPDIEAVLADLETLLPADAQIPRGLRIHAVVSERARNWSLALTITSPSGTQTRTFEAEDCRDLVATTAVVTATWILETPASVLPEAPDAHPRRGGEASRAASPAASAPTQRPPHTSWRRSAVGRVDLRAEARLGLAVLPNLDAGLGLMVTWSHRLLRLEGGARYLFTQRYATEAPGAGIDLRYAGAIVRGCAVPAWRRIGLPLCAGLEFGALSGLGSGDAVVGATRTTDIYGAFELSANLRARVHRRVHLWFGAELAVAFLRPPFVVVGTTPYTSPAVGGRASAGVEITISPRF